MIDNKIRSLANNFRRKIDMAQQNGLLVGTMMENFPVQCCGVTCTLLAEFLLDNGIETLWISSEEFETQESHAWLVVKDERIDRPYLCYNDVPNDILGLFSTYGGGNPESFREDTNYEEQNVKNGLIIDITGDQFNEVSVYVGYTDNFHKRFEFLNAYEYEGLISNEYKKLYDIIISQ